LSQSNLFDGGGLAPSPRGRGRGERESEQRTRRGCEVPLPNPLPAGEGASLDTVLEMRRTLSKQKVALRHRQHGGGLAGQQLPIGAHLVGLGVDFHERHVAVQHHVLFANFANGFYR
jgi:hypothetical protein